MCFEGIRQKHSCTENQWENISTVNIIQLKLFKVLREYLQSTLKSVDGSQPGRASWVLKKSGRQEWRTFQEG